VFDDQIVATHLLSSCMPLASGDHSINKNIMAAVLHSNQLASTFMQNNSFITAA
jgi:hypothetical protein